MVPRGPARGSTAAGATRCRPTMGKESSLPNILGNEKRSLGAKNHKTASHTDMGKLNLTGNGDKFKKINNLFENTGGNDHEYATLDNGLKHSVKDPLKTMRY